MLESKRQKKITDFFHSIGAWTVKVIQGNKGGVPDLITCVPMNKEEVLHLFEHQEVIGVFVAAEIKQPKGTTSATQARNIKQINRAGGIAFSYMTSVEDIQRILTTQKTIKLRRSRRPKQR